MKMKVSWTMNYFKEFRGGTPKPDSYASRDELYKITSYAKLHDVLITTECGPIDEGESPRIGGGGEARIFFEGDDIRDLLQLSKLAEKAMLDAQFGVSSPIIPRREFVGDGAEDMNVLLAQIDECRQVLRRVAPYLEGGFLARGHGAIAAGEEIDLLLEMTL